MSRINTLARRPASTRARWPWFDNHDQSARFLDRWPAGRLPLIAADYCRWILRRDLVSAPRSGRLGCRVEQFLFN